MTPRQVFESIPTTPSGDQFIKAVTPEQLAVIMSDPALKAMGLAPMDAYMEDFREEFSNEPYIVAHLRIQGVWVVTLDLQAQTDPSAPRIVKAAKRDRTAMVFVAVILFGLIAVALASGGRL